MDSTPENHPSDDIWLGEYSGQLPTTLNVLTILTIVWNSFSILAHFGSFALAPFGYRNSVNNQGTMDNLPPFVRSLLGNTQEAARLAYVNRVPILLIGLLGVLLCLFGAIRMRKRKKIGFVLYVIGDLVPLLDMFFMTTPSTFTGVIMAFSYGVALLFVIFYATQLKYMK